jgi:hypothetical protein
VTMRPGKCSEPEVPFGEVWSERVSLGVAETFPFEASDKPGVGSFCRYAGDRGFARENIV